jgi:hypothetical protein
MSYRFVEAHLGCVKLTEFTMWNSLYNRKLHMIAKFLSLISRIIYPGVSKYCRMEALATAFFNLGNVRLLSQCARFGHVHKVRLCAALLRCTDEVTQRWHNQPPHCELAITLHLLATLQLVATSQSFVLLVIRCSASPKSHDLVKERCTRQFAGHFG